MGITLAMKQMLIGFFCFFFQDISFTDDQCFYFMFPVRGGTFNSVNKKIRKHEMTPSLSADRICIRPCVRGTCRHIMEAGTLWGLFKWKQFGDLKNSPSRGSLLRRSINWCLSGMPAPVLMATIFNGLCAFVQNNHWSGSIWTSLIQVLTVAQCSSFQAEISRVTSEHNDILMWMTQVWRYGDQ